MVQNGTETKTDHVTVAAILADIRDGGWQKLVAHVKTRYSSALQAAKQQGDPDPYKTAKEAVHDIKKRLPGVLFSGEFSQRANEHIIAHSGLLCLDIDHLEDGPSLKLALANDDYVQACFDSPTGSGLKVLVRIEPDVTSHGCSFLAAQKYFWERYGAKVDNCKDVARLCFVSDDENIFIRAEEATLLEPLPPESKPEAAPPPPRDIDAELTAKCGAAYYVTSRGAVVINESYFVQRICRENLVFFEHDENRFWRYNAVNGAWEAVVPELIKELVRSEWERLTDLFDEPGLAFKINNGLLNALVSGIRSHSARSKVFKRLKSIIHSANGMLEIHSDGSWELMPFSPAYYARNPTSIVWDPDATCPKFDALLEFGLPPDDISLFWRWFGSVLLTGNAAQRILLLIGKAATAKSTIAEVVEMVRGLTNCTALRTKFLHERFEIGRLFGFSFLTAKDVPGRFLEEDGAQALKKLVGHDYVPGEVKGSMVSVPVYGDFDCVVTCNERLLVRLEGDTDVEAWRRRLMIFEFLNVIPEEERISNYAQILFAEEAPGILRKAVAGAIDHLAELEARCNFIETDEQKAAWDHLLSESESVKYFVAERVQRVVGGPGLATEELVTAYMKYCDERNLAPLRHQAGRTRSPRYHDVNPWRPCWQQYRARNGKRARGYPHVALVQVTKRRRPVPRHP